MSRNELAPDFYFDSDDFYEKLETQRFFIMPVIDANNNKFIFKARLEDHEETKKIFDREIQFPQYIKKLNIPSLNVPDIKKAEYNPIEWYIYTFIETDASGDIFGLLEKYQENFSVQSVVSTIIALQNNTKKITSQENFIEIPKNNSENFLKLFDKFSHSVENLITTEEINKARDILLQSRDILDNSTTVLAHGDLHPGNIILDEKDSPPSVTLIDWAGVQINNCVYDIAFLWTTLSSSPDIQNKLIQEFKKTVSDDIDFDKLFNLDLLIIIPQIIDRFNYIMEHTGDKFDDRIEFLVGRFKEIVG
ncbi:hypothetical protein D4R87_00765 [bacterium]|nr:MAG: hypothetical protein D4R87_00765 [bacterium]